MKKTIGLLSLLILFWSVPSFAANKVERIDITVDIQDNGHAQVTQVWRGTFDEGTECYIVQENMNGMTIENFTVSGGDTQFTPLDEWDVDASRAEKAQKSGVVKTGGGYELCWGIGEYGANTYTVSYLMTNMVRSFDDYDGFNIRFINDAMSTPPTYASVTIGMNGMPLTADNSAIWGFGYEGQIVFENGIIHAYTEKAMGSKNHMTIMVRLNKGMVTPYMMKNGSFETMKDTALEGSDYKQPWTFYLIFILPIVLVATPIIISIVGTVKRKKAYNRAEFYRSPPQNGALPASLWLALKYKQCNDKNAIVGATLLKFIDQGCLHVLTAEEEAFLGLSTKKTTALKLVHPPQTQYPYEDALFSCIQKAAGEDGILQEKELQKWCQSHYKQFMAIADDAVNKGEFLLEDLGAFRPSGGGLFSSKKLSDQGVQELNNLYGFKKYLLEFSLISEREVVEVGIWRDFLSYATLFGIADKVAQQFKHLYPAYFEQMDYDVTRAIYISHRMHRAAYLGSNNGYTAAQMRSSGGGGSSSFGGGGGFSGGGSGGGTR